MIPLQKKMKKGPKKPVKKFQEADTMSDLKGDIGKDKR